MKVMKAQTMSAMPWIKKYSVQTTVDIVGQDNAIKTARMFIKDYKNQKKKALLIYGPSGVGKTSSIYAIAEELNLEVLEVNASDFRSRETINSIVGTASKQLPLFSSGKLILVDEVDCLSGTKDRGGMQAIIKVVNESSFPIVCTATNPYELKLSSLRNKCMLLEYEALDYTMIYEKLKDICKKENIKFEKQSLKSVARRAAGDMRAAINDLQTLTHDKKELTRDDIDILGDRNKLESMIDALVKIFKAKEPKIAVGALDNVNEDTDQVFLWVDENLPKEYIMPEDLVRAYEKLSRADVFKGRIKRWQHWRFLVYINALLTAGVAVSKDEKYREFVKYSPTQRLLKIWKANMKYQKRKAIAGKIAKKTHSSVKDTIKNTYPYIQFMMKKKKEYRAAFADYFDFDAEEVEWLAK